MADYLRATAEFEVTSTRALPHGAQSMGQMSNRHDGWDSDDWVDDLDFDDAAKFEKTGRRERASLPVSRSKVGGHSSKETAGSRKVRRSISQKSGGIHRRRIKKIL
jgi:hypothetical protein